MNTVLKIEFLSNVLSQIKGCFLTARTIQEKARRNDGTRTSYKTEIDGSKNEENSELRDEKEQREKRKLFEDW